MKDTNQADGIIGVTKSASTLDQPPVNQAMPDNTDRGTTHSPAAIGEKN